MIRLGRMRRALHWPDLAGGGLPGRIPIGPCPTAPPLRFPGCRYGEDYGYDGRIDDIYAKEVGPRLNGSHYMDFTGGFARGGGHPGAAFVPVFVSGSAPPCSCRTCTCARTRASRRAAASPALGLTPPPCPAAARRGAVLDEPGRGCGAGSGRARVWQPAQHQSPQHADGRAD